MAHEPAVAGGDSAALAGLAQFTSGRTKKLVGGYLLGQSIWKGGKALYDRVIHEWAHTIVVDSDDDLFPDVMAWLYQSIPEARRRSLRARTASGDSTSAVTEGSDRTPARLSLHYDGRRAQRVNIDGHRVKVEVDEDNDIDRNSEGRLRFKHYKVTFTCRDIAGRNAVVRFLKTATAQRVRTGPRLYMGTRWGNWHRAGGAPLRDFATVALTPGMEDDMVGDLERFFSQEADYARLGLPWHRGFLLHGPPGTGKTSIAKALASRFDLDMYFVPLSDMEDDTGLMQMFSNVEPHSLLLLEDVDIAHATRERDDQGTGVSMSGLLQALDGVVTPHGLVTVMTTNKVEELDEGLIRAGRADRQFEVGYLGHLQLERLVEVLTGEWAEMPDPHGLDLAPVDVVEILKTHIGSPIDAAEAVRVYVEKRRAGMLEHVA